MKSFQQLRVGRGMVVGLLAAAAGIAVAELAAAATRPEAAPLVTIGGTVIDATPTPVKEFAVRTFGTSDKPVLLGSICIGLALFAAVVGLVSQRNLAYGLVGVGIFGLAGAAAALARPASQPADPLPAVFGAVVAAVVLAVLRRAVLHQASGSLPSRRAFLSIAVAVAGGTAVVGASAVALGRASERSASRSRQSVRLPAPADPAPALPPGTASGFYTANRDFYRVDTALAVPRINVDGWRLRIRGMVEWPATLSFADLLGRRLIERDITLNCVSNEVGGPYVGTARWLGVPLAPLLRETGIAAGADQVVARSSDGMTIGTPVQTVLDGRDAMLAVGMNGEALPLEHGFPVRMLVPGLYGYASACKWIVDIELSTFASFDAYWVRRGWAARAPVKTASRIDRPAPFAHLNPGPVTVAGVAWAQHRGISAVQVQVDDGPWRVATLLPVPSSDTWVQWRYAWQATPGDHTLRVRATDGAGQQQTAQRTTPFPDGATGWHAVSVQV